ncbi:MAG: hypothetical protein D3906_11515, partial [Candidatus Electrothrix sp. AUS1_2]|nr:hypothetical protein [Candidatus Electrothrix sp. AUS1_2]
MPSRIKTVSGRSGRYFLPPLLLLICLLLVNGCTRKTPAPEASDEPASEIETIRKLSEATLEDDEQAEQEAEDQTENQRPAKEKKRKLRKKRADRERKKLPATQRPYVIEGQTYYPIPTAEGYEETGTASWYGDPFHGRKTANGETYNMYSETASWYGDPF